MADDFQVRKDIDNLYKLIYKEIGDLDTVSRSEYEELVIRISRLERIVDEIDQSSGS